MINTVTLMRRAGLRNPALIAVAAMSLVLGVPAAQAQGAAVKNVVLVHGAWADGSGWQAVHKILRGRGYKVSIVQNPLTSLQEDVAATNRVLERQDGPAILVGHSYGGVVITEAGGAANVAGLVYVAAFVPDAGESLLGMIKGGPQPPVQPSKDGFLFFDPAIFPAAFAGDLGKEAGAFLADSQVAVAVAAFGAPVTRAAWKSKPSWVLVTTDDHIIPPAAQTLWAKRAGATVTLVKASHAVFMSQPAAVADLIETAAKQAKTGTR
jgi:pimeloyl-ACP methyl ester carboxylesterase